MTISHSNINHYDLIILGGGINGAGIARDAAGRGLKVLLCEKGDLACGTSMKSSKLIHGGLRYLELGEFRLVREALAEREVLLKIAPHIIWPLNFYLPWESHLRPRWMIRLGLFLYDHLAKHPSLPNSRSVNFQTLLDNPLKDSFQYGFSYADCGTEDSRLVTLNALDAQYHGATILTYADCQQITRTKDHWQCTIKPQNGMPLNITSKAFINACGPWVDEVNQSLLKVITKHHLKKVQGSHIIIKKIMDQKQAFILQLPDKRIMFVLPFEDNFQLVGTTDVELTGSADTAHISQEEIDYLIHHFNYYFDKKITRQDVVWSFCGVRGLIDDGTQNPSATSRDYVLELDDSAAPLLSIFGGKITTYRKLAAHAVNLLAPRLNPSQGEWTHTQALPGGENITQFEQFQNQCLAQYSYLDHNLVARLCRYYGTRIHQILANTTFSSDLGIHFGGDLYACEIDYLLQHEFAKTADDILWRRTKIGLYTTQADIDRLNQYISTRMI